MSGHLRDPGKRSVIRQKETSMQEETQIPSTEKLEIWKMERCSSTKKKKKKKVKWIQHQVACFFLQLFLELHPLLWPSDPSHCDHTLPFSVLFCVLKDQSINTQVLLPSGYQLGLANWKNWLRDWRAESERDGVFNFHSLPMFCRYSLEVDAFLFG